MKKFLSSLAAPLALWLFGIAIPAAAAPGDLYDYSHAGDKNYINNTAILERSLGTSSSNNQSLKIVAPRAQVSATFTAAPITVDAIREAAWDAATPYPIVNKFNTAMNALAPAATAEGTVRMLWDGPVLYVFVEVTGDATKSDTAVPTWSAASYTPTTDGLVVNMDVFNDQWGMETDTQGVFFMGANPAAPITSFNNSGIPSLGSFFNPNNQDHSPRLKAFKSSGYVAGTGVNYTYEFALQIEGWGDAWERPLVNGTKIGLELGIFNQGASFTWLSKTLYYAGNEGGSNLPNSERVRNRDWAEVTLSGWDGTAPFAYSGWRADEAIRFWNSKSNPGATGAANSGDNSVVWTADTKNLMVGAKNAYLALKASGTATRSELEAAVQAVGEAFAVLTWADTRFPDPHDLPVQQTLPNIWQFFDPAKGTNGMVTNLSQWNQRKQELRELAQFYEYGYKPKLGVDYTISLVTNAYAGVGNPTVVARVTPTNVNFNGGVASNLTITVTLPTAGLPAGEKAVIGFSTAMTANGIANVGLPTGWGADIRSDVGAWGSVATGNRTGTFYTFFPYARNSTSADVSYEMATATGVSIFLDILQMAVAENAALDAKIDPTRAVTKGFSINGKLAFVAAVFDERVKAVIAGGAGATGPANWRYNAQGQEFDFTGTPFFNPGAANIVSHGTEGPGNSYRHNRVRETELFRHFMPYGHMYAHEESSYGYGGYSRLPFDQALLVATLAPDRAIIIDTNLNDYNDGAVTDNMSLQVAKLVYQGLNVDADYFVKFNSGNYVSAGDPHGAAGATPEAHYMSDFFYGTQTLTAAEAVRLNTDPYNLPVCNGQTQTPYDYYWGGFNTITGGTGGIAGTGGWHTYNLSPPTSTISPTEQTATVGDTVSFTVTATGSGTLTYQWRKDGAALVVGGVASGIMSPHLTLTNITTADAGSYDCVVTSPMGSSTSPTGTLTVNRGVAIVTLDSLSATYDGLLHAATATTTPAGRMVAFTYDGAPAPPVDAGSYAVVATVDDADYTGSAVGTLVIAPANAPVTLSGLVQAYDGTPKSVSVATTPAGLPVIVTYAGNANAPIYPGSYTVVATVDSPNYQGTASGTLVIATTVVVRHAPSLNGGIDGSLQVMTPETITLSGAAVTGDLVVPGTPTIQLNGKSVYAGTIDGGGASTPSNYQVTLNGAASLRHLVRQVDPVALPVVAAPPTPVGTRDVALNNPSQSPGDFATLRNLTLNNNAGSVTVPAGTYGSFAVNGSSSLVLGVAGATEPAVYNLQGLAVNGSGQVKIVGPVIINLAAGISLSGPIGEPAHPEWLKLNFATGGLALNANVRCDAYVVAPAGTVTINRNSTLNGGVISDHLSVSGGGLVKVVDPQ